MNKSEEVRKLLTEQPKIMPMEAVKVLKDRGVDVTPGFVSTTKTNLKKHRRTLNGAKSAAAPSPRSSNESLSLSSLLLAKRFVNEVGGIQQAKTAVDVLERLL